MHNKKALVELRWELRTRAVLLRTFFGPLRDRLNEDLLTYGAKEPLLPTTEDQSFWAEAEYLFLARALRTLLETETKAVESCKKAGANLPKSRARGYRSQQCHHPRKM